MSESEKVDEQPMITILLAVYNGENYLKELINSIINQDYQNWELIISDDQSKDHSNQLIDQYCEIHSDKIHRFVSGKRFGNACSHFLYMLGAHIEKEYIMLCDQDDVWHPNKVSKMITKMLEASRDYNGPLLLHSDLTVVDKNLNVINPSFKQYSKTNGEKTKLNDLLIQNCVTGCTMIMNQPLIQALKCGLQADHIIMHDWWIALIACITGKVIYVPESTIDYRLHGNNSEGINKLGLRYITKRIKENRFLEEIKNTSKQVESLYRCYNKQMNLKDKTTCAAYKKLYQSNYFKRKGIYLKYHIYKAGVLRVLEQMILG